MHNRGTIGRHLFELAENQWTKEDFLLWPPDVFALASSLLHSTGCYRMLFHNWHCTRGSIYLKEDSLHSNIDNRRKWWSRSIVDISNSWANVSKLPSSKKAPVSKSKESIDDSLFLFIRFWWAEICKNESMPLTQLREAASYSSSAPRSRRKKDKDAHRVIIALVQLVAAADEACCGVGFGLPNGLKPNEKISYDSLGHITQEGQSPKTLCSKIVDDTKVVVLPKGRTAQVGATFRSLTHHLAFWRLGEVTPGWRYLPEAFDKALNEHRTLRNLLVLPWPERVDAESISPTRRPDASIDMPSSFGFFEYKPKRFDKKTLNRLKQVIQKAINDVGHIDGIIFPEMAMHPDDHEKVLNCIYSLKLPHILPFVIAGVGRPPNKIGAAGVNKLIFSLGHYIQFEQSKHHRWKMDRLQIKNYGLTNRLHPAVNWWEAHSIEDRRVEFTVLGDGGPLLSVLICEDLARQDPVAELVRTVGPSLIIALLMDGPQLKQRWPARYATVLAEDPGSSVLTITSIGMVELSGRQHENASRVVALWKESGGRDEEISLEEGSSGFILSLEESLLSEFSADGRDDACSTPHLSLAGIRQVKIDR